METVYVADDVSIKGKRLQLRTSKLLIYRTQRFVDNRQTTKQLPNYEAVVLSEWNDPAESEVVSQQH